MKLQAAVDGENYEIAITRDEGRLFARVDDRAYECAVSETERNVFLFKHEGKIYEVFVSPPMNASGQYVSSVSGTDLEITLADPKRLRGSAGGTADASGKVEIKTAMPGKVVRILVAEGDNVEAGDGVIVVEAMKMQNEMRSPRSGIIKTIAVNEGDTVGAGQLLSVIE